MQLKSKNQMVVLSGAQKHVNCFDQGYGL